MQRIHVTIRPLNREDSVLYFPPEAFGPFRVLHQIGAGTLGPVFRAHDPADDRLVAVKVFRLDLTPEQAAALVTELETLIAANINHPGIAVPIASGLARGVPYLAQEYAVGDSLDVALRERGQLPIPEVVTLVESLAPAIDYAAALGVHHERLHPRDILLSADGVRITGFGISAALSKIGAKPPARPQYSSTNIASDVYALGAIAFEAATGKRASSENLRELEAQHGAALRRAFDLALGANADSRARRAGDFAAALAAARAIGATGAVGATPAKAAPVEAAFLSEVETPVHSIEPIDPDDPLDPVINLGGSHTLELDASSDVTDATSRVISTPAFASARGSQPPAEYPADVGQEDPAGRRWPIIAMFLAFAVLVALTVGYFLRSPRPTPATDQELAVDSTVVDLPAAAAPSSANAAPGKPTPPSPSRPASGAVRGPQTGSVLIRSTPADAEVLVNGKLRGRTPLALRDLALGSYTIRVERDGYATEERTLQLTTRRPTTSTTINLRSAAARSAVAGDTSVDKTGLGGLNVQSRPAGARVFVNNRLAGATPIAIAGLPAGSATVRIEMDGYQPWTTTVGVSAGAQTRVAASLERQ